MLRLAEPSKKWSEREGNFAQEREILKEKVAEWKYEFWNKYVV